MEIGLRYYTELQSHKNKKRVVKDPSSYETYSFEKILVIDTECDITPAQSLKFGTAVVITKNLAVERSIIFFNPNKINEKELKELEDYCIENPFVKLYTREQFIRDIFYNLSYMSKIPVVFFNAAFDISRLAVSFSPAKKNMRGGFLFKLLSDNDNKNQFPGIRIKKLTNSHVIEFAKTQYSKNKGCVIDTMVLSQIFSDDKKITLRQSCERYNKIYKKLEVSDYTKIDEQMLTYALTDSLATGELFYRLKAEFDRFQINLPIQKLYSSASLGKAALLQLGIYPNSNYDPEVYGMLIASYTGGRVQLGVRHCPTKISILDFYSLYPTLYCAAGLYSYQIAQNIEYFDDTESVKQFLDKIKSVDDLRDKNIWKSLCVVCEVLPTDDLLPIRAKFDNENFSVAVCHVTSKEPIYYSLASIIGCKISTGKIPNIKRAIRFSPSKKTQSTLKESTILGIKINPIETNVFQFLAEERQRMKISNDDRSKQIKILINSSVYGINLEQIAQDYKEKVIVYSNGKKFTDFKRYEQPGIFFNPLVATTITACGKLFIQICECLLNRYQKKIIYCDTDSCFLPSEYTDEIINWFDFLSPYSNVKHILKLEDKDKWFYGISSKRYVTYTISKNGKFEINENDYSLHGLGFLLNPFEKTEEHWHKEVWLDILRLHYKQITLNDLLNKYRNYYAISKFVVSTPSLMKRFDAFNKGKCYDDMIKPNNFFLIGLSNFKHVKPIAPFSREPQSMPYSKFINYYDGSIMEGQHYFKNLADEIYSYINHPESKMEGTVGILTTKHITIDNIVYVAKESHKIQNNLSGLEKLDYNVAIDPKDIEKLLSLSWKQVKESGISRTQFYEIKKQLKEGETPVLRSKTLNRLRNITFSVPT